MATFGISRFARSFHAAIMPLNVGAPIVLPANGPWIIHAVWGVAVAETPSALVSLGGAIGLQSNTGDFEPDPTPIYFPWPVCPIALNFDASLLDTPIRLRPTHIRAPGKSTIQLIAIWDFPAVGQWLWVTGGIILSDNPPRDLPLTRSARIIAGIISTAETAVGIIQLPESADRLIGLSAYMYWTVAPADNEVLIGTVRLQSDDEALQPAEYPISFACNGRETANVTGSTLIDPLFVPLDTQVPPGSRISVFATLPSRTATNAVVDFTLYYGS